MARARGLQFGFLYSSAAPAVLPKPETHSLPSKAPQLMPDTCFWAWVDCSLPPELSEAPNVKPSPNARATAVPSAAVPRRPAVAMRTSAGPGARGSVLPLSLPRQRQGRDGGGDHDRLEFHLSPPQARAVRPLGRGRRLGAKTFHNTTDQDEKVTFLRRLTVAGIYGRGCRSEWFVRDPDPSESGGCAAAD